MHAWASFMRDFTLSVAMEKAAKTHTVLLVIAIDDVGLFPTQKYEG